MDAGNKIPAEKQKQKIVLLKTEENEGYIRKEDKGKHERVTQADIRNKVERIMIKK